MINSLIDGLWQVIVDALYVTTPLIIILLIMQFTILKLNKSQLLLIIKGILIVFVGLVLFVHGVNISYINSGSLIGEVIGASNYSWIMVPISFFLGFIVTFAEPSVKILNNEIENVTSGFINKKVVLYFLSIGVAFALTIAIIRIMFNIPLLYILIPGYLITLILIKYVNSLFVGIAFDAGGAVTGPMIATFLLSVTISYSNALNNSNILVDTLGMISLVALTPVISILLLGLIYRKKGGCNE